MDKKANRSAVVVLAIFALIVSYPLSAGPTSLLYKHVHLHVLLVTLRAVYEPLNRLPYSLKVPILRWVELWVGPQPDITPPGTIKEFLNTPRRYPKESARKSAWQFLNKTADPRLSMLRKFAEAVGCSVKSLV